MKKYYITIILLVILSNIAIPQRTYQVKDSTDIERISYLNYHVKKLNHDGAILDSLFINVITNDSVSQYYKFVYKAEDEYLKENYEVAALYYEAAFSYLTYPFSKDLANAKECEIKSRKNIDNIKKYSYLLLNKFAKSNERIKRYVYCKGLSVEDSLYIANMIDTMQISVNEDVYKELKEIHKYDQEARKDLGEVRTNEQNILLITTDSVNCQRILELIDKYPNFSEEVFDAQMWSTISIVLNHLRGSPNLEIFIKLFPLVNSGKIDARLYAESLELSTFKVAGEYGFGLRGFGQIISNLETKDKVYIFIKQKGEKTINKYREKIYVENIRNFHKKRVLDMINERGRRDIGICDAKDFYKIINTSRYFEGQRVKIYYKSKEDEKRIKKAAKEYYKNNSVN